MKDVKKNLKVISRSMTKEFMIDYAIIKGEEAIVNTAIKYIPNPTAQMAVGAAGFAGSLYVALKFTKEERRDRQAALYDMIAGMSKEELENEIKNGLRDIK